jgi:arabinan endo-1,5-alpha-L-arabinosidase
MYCTTDPLNDEDLDADGNLVFHPVPMMVSRDLVNWRYVGDALPELPSWAADEARMWAPDVVHSRATGRWYMTFTVTDVKGRVSGERGCAGDSAIGVAVSDSPLGPWRTTDEPLVGPRRDPDDVDQAGCQFLWTFDPDVLGDHVGRNSVLYYGSYYGGIFATDVRLRANGMQTEGAPTRIAIGNRYEGTNVVKRGDWYYFFGSATNCCNGPLTGYSVYSGRSRSPYGPFRDREGNSLLAGRVGGTPVISMNGNRWVGTGHNTTFRDEGGQWWTIYHAVDRHDPFFETDPGFTKRPALLDPIDWVNGWPMVRAGRWASDHRMPAPAAQPGQVSRYQPRRVEPQRPGRVIRVEEFDGSQLSDRWRWVRRPADSEYSVSGGALRMKTAAGDLSNETNSAPVLTTRLPQRDVVVQTRVRLNLPPEGCCYNFVQAGLVLYANDDRFIKLTHVSIYETRQTEFAKEVPRVPAEYPRYGNTVVGAPGLWTTLRIVRDGRRYTAYTRADGQGWVRGGTWTHTLGDDARIGLVAMGGEGFRAQFSSMKVWSLAD